MSRILSLRKHLHSSLQSWIKLLHHIGCLYGLQRPFTLRSNSSVCCYSGPHHTKNTTPGRLHPPICGVRSHIYRVLTQVNNILLRLCPGSYLKVPPVFASSLHLVHCCWISCFCTSSVELIRSKSCYCIFAIDSTSASVCYDFRISMLLARPATASPHNFVKPEDWVKHNWPLPFLDIVIVVTFFEAATSCFGLNL